MMKKVLLGFLLLISGLFFLFNKTRIVDSEDLAVYVNDELVSSIPKKGEAMFIKSVCDNNAKATWDNETWGLLVTNMTKKTKCNLYFYERDTVFDFGYTGAEQVFTVPASTTYKIELWGAQGGGGSKGGYVSGNIFLASQSKLYLYIGEFPSYISASCYETNKNTSFNGNSIGSCAGGGGASDVRLVKGENWSDFDSLKSRIMVAGGGGAIYTDGTGGAAGGLIGYDGSGFSSYYKYTIGKGGGQTSGYFGYSGKDTTTGGGGYYAGFHGSAADAGGGSSFISGHNGCDAIKEESTEDNIIHTGQSIHYSGYYFTDTLMIDGEGYKWTDKKEDYVGMPSHSDNTTMTGNTGNGYARITLVSIDE